MAGQAALPRQSGELIFQDPWEGLAFALAVALCEQGHYSWADFQQRLIAHIAAAEQQDSELRPTCYECWLSALEAFLVDKAILSPKKLTRRAGWLAGMASPPGSRLRPWLVQDFPDDEP